MSELAKKNSNGSAISVPLLDVNRGNALIRDEILEAIARVYDSGRFINGPDCQHLEQSFAKLCDAKFAIGCASGSDALLLALMSCNIGPGDEVVVPSFTFFATASAVTRLGATIVFADIDPVTFNVDPLSVEAAITSRTKAIIPVHLFGQCADMDAVIEIASSRSLHVIEDAAQAVGAKYNGQAAGSIGDIGCFSFYPTKNLGALGDGGMLTTNNSALADRLRLLTSHGMQPRYYHREVGINSRLDSIQAAALSIKLKYLEQYANQRQKNAVQYQELMSASELTKSVKLPQTAPTCDHVWNQYTIRVQDGLRDELRLHLSNLGIGSEIYYPVPMHMQECFKQKHITQMSLKETERAAAEVLSLPIFPELSEIEQQTVVLQINSFLHGSANAENLSRRLAS